MAAPRKGEIVDGYEFLGGDPNDERSWQKWGPGARALPDGSIVRDGPRGGLQWLRKAEGGQGGEPLREFEINAAARATLMDEGLREYNRARKEGYNPGSAQNQIARGAEGIWAAGPFIADLIRDNPSERGRAAELQFVDGALRTTSGANAPEPEVVRANRAYFRQPGESEGVEANKALIRQRFRDTSVKAAGRAYIPRSEKPPVPMVARQAAARLRAQGVITQSGTFGSRANPFVARSKDVFDRLVNNPAYKGKYVISPDGDFGVIE